MSYQSARWHSVNDDMEYAETDDPRVLAVIQREHEPLAPYGIALAPAYWLDYPHDPRPAGDVYRDDESDRVAAAWQGAHAYAVNASYGSDAERLRAVHRDPDAFTARYLAIFHDSYALIVNHPTGRVLLLSTPNHRELVGIGNESAAGSLEFERDEWLAYLNGDFYGIGYATNLSRVFHNAKLDFDTFTVEMQCWGFAGTEYAREEAMNMDCGGPDLPPMLDI